MTLDELKNININDLSSLPLPVKIFGIIVVCALILVGGYIGFIADELETKARAEDEEQQLRETYLNKKLQALNIDIYRQQMEEMERTFGSLLRQLPNTTEVPDLLVDITQAGLGHGLEFTLFRPEREQPKDFYAELPISLTVSGTYHELAQFISDVAALPRIVTFGDITLSGDKGTQLNMVATARTYRYMESAPAPAPKRATPDNKQKTPEAKK